MQDWSSFGFWKDLVLCALAIYAAVLSTYNWRQSIRKEKRTLKVEFNSKIPAYADGTLGPTFLEVRSTNIGHRQVTVTNMGLQTEMKTVIWSTKVRNKNDVLVDTILPITLSDGQSAHLHFSYREIGLALMNGGFSSKTILIPICFDSVGSGHRGPPCEVNPVEWSNM